MIRQFLAFSLLSVFVAAPIAAAPLVGSCPVKGVSRAPDGELTITFTVAACELSPFVIKANKPTIIESCEKYALLAMANPAQYLFTGTSFGSCGISLAPTGTPAP